MRKDAFTISPEMSVIELANMMQEGKPKVYPVVENKKLVGIISRREVLKAISDNLDKSFKHQL